MKRVLGLVLLGGVIALAVAVAQTPLLTSPSTSFIVRGKQLAPVTLNLSGKNPAQVYWGSYIVNAEGACNECHTCPSYASGHNPFAGQTAQINAANYMAGGVRFGPFVSSNLTPDASGDPAGLTQAQFLSTLHTGTNPQGHLLQVMPWPAFGNMTDHDLKAVYAYLSALPSAMPGTCSGAGEAAP
jgi:hypothetical protein